MISAEEFGAIYQRDFDYTKNFLLSRRAHPEEVEDLVQEAWTKGWKYINQFNGQSSLTTWINVIALNELRDHIRRKACRPIEEKLDFEVLSLTPFPFDRIDLSVQLQVCCRKDKKILQLVLEGFSREEIGMTLGISKGTTKVRLHYICRRLHKRIKERTKARARQIAPRIVQEAPTEEASSFTKKLLFYAGYSILILSSPSGGFLKLSRK